MDNKAKSVGVDLVMSAKEQVRIGEKPDWVVLRSFSSQFKAESHAPVTHLLLDTQVHAERHEWFVHQAIRLETMEAVQHHSQWRLQYEPKTQRVTLHSLKIRRGETETSHLYLDKAHFLQREEGLERFVIHGWFTLLMVLDDVRPGDTLEYSYTIESRSRLLPDNNSYFFTLPPAVSVGSYHFSAQFNPARPMKWKSSSDLLKPVEDGTETAVLWEWTGDNYMGAKPELNTPAWHLANPWIQISDFSDWQTITSAVSSAWAAEVGDGESVAKFVGEIESRHMELPARIEAAIRLVQDECRYFSANLELGGQVPSTPEIVMQRRFGDCKDLSWLLVNLLKRLGVSARPVLVNAFLRKTIGELLPTPALFNHVVVEFENGGEKCWVDTTLKNQGGGPFGRIVPEFGWGLPVEAAATELVNPPKISNQTELVEVRETILLDTRGGTSLLAIIHQSTGWQADLLRHQLAQIGTEELARQRLQSAASRFHNATRVGALLHRDDREVNRFVLAETFEIKPLLNDHPNGKLCRFLLPVGWLAGVLAQPDKTARITPFLLPHPCRIHYAIEVESSAVKNMNIQNPRSSLGSACVEFSRKERAGNGYWVMNLEVETKADFVPAKEVDEHRQIVEQIWRSASRELSVFKGYPRPRQKTGFGALPFAPVVAPPPLPAVARPANTFVNLELKPDQQTSRKHRHKEFRRDNFPIGLKIGLVVFVVFWLLIILLAKARHHL
jgi:transglutaminase-like putative cysteine protease